MPWLASVGAFVRSPALSPAGRSAARRPGLVARPRADRWRRSPTALLGGLANACNLLDHIHGPAAGVAAIAAPACLAENLVEAYRRAGVSLLRCRARLEDLLPGNGRPTPETRRI